MNEFTYNFKINIDEFEKQMETISNEYENLTEKEKKTLGKVAGKLINAIRNSIIIKKEYLKKHKVGGYQSIGFKEGKEKLGGIRPKPKTKRPNVAPCGQRVNVSLE